jgi:MFS family permease
VLTARFADRIGKGIRGAPRDALVADATPSDMRGAAFGLRQSLDTAGALIGPLVAIGLMYAFADNVRAVFWVAVVPAIIAVAALAFGVDEPKHSAAEAKRSVVPRWTEMRALGRPFWMAVVIGTLITLARFSEAFLIVRASDAGLALAWTPLALVVMNLTFVASTYPAGRMSDRIGRAKLLLVGMGVLIAADIVLILATGWSGVLVGIALWGLHLGLTQGLLSALVADTAPSDLRGSAFGVFYFVTGLTAVVSSLLAGALWELSGPAATFAVGAGFAALSMAALFWRAAPSLNDSAI